jgi:hypothetical protein
VRAGCLGKRATSLINNRLPLPAPLGPTLWPTVGSYEDAFAYERGTPVQSRSDLMIRQPSKVGEFGQVNEPFQDFVASLVAGIRGVEGALPLSLCLSLCLSLSASPSASLSLPLPLPLSLSLSLSLSRSFSGSLSVCMFIFLSLFLSLSLSRALAHARSRSLSRSLSLSLCSLSFVLCGSPCGVHYTFALLLVINIILCSKFP